MSTLAFFGWVGWQEALIVTAVALLIFGRRLPTVARSIGRTVVEFRRGLGHS